VDNIVQSDRQATDNSTARAHAYWIPLATSTVCNTRRFSAATMVALTRLIVTFYVHCLSCLILPTFCKQYRASKLKLSGGRGGEAVVTRSVPVGMYR
jgi:hypothetical protein